MSSCMRVNRVMVLSGKAEGEKLQATVVPSALTTILQGHKRGQQPRVRLVGSLSCSEGLASTLVKTGTQVQGLEWIPPDYAGGR